MKITKRDLLRIIAEEASAISTEKVLKEGTVEDIETAVEEAIQEFITTHGREPSMTDVNWIIAMAMDHGDEGLVDLDAPRKFDPKAPRGKDIQGVGQVRKARVGESDYPLKESLRKLIRRHTKTSERVAVEGSIQEALRKVLSEQ